MEPGLGQQEGHHTFVHFLISMKLGRAHGVQGKGLGHVGSEVMVNG